MPARVVAAQRSPDPRSRPLHPMDNHDFAFTPTSWHTATILDQKALAKDAQRKEAEKQRSATPRSTTGRSKPTRSVTPRSSGGRQPDARSASPRSSGGRSTPRKTKQPSELKLSSMQSGESGDGLTTPRKKRPQSAPKLGKAVADLNDCGFKIMPWAENSRIAAGTVAGSGYEKRMGLQHNRRGEWTGPADVMSDNIVPFDFDGKASFGSVAGYLNQDYRVTTSDKWKPCSPRAGAYDGPGEEAKYARRFGGIPIEGYKGYIPVRNVRDHRGPSPVCFHDDMYWQTPMRRDRLRYDIDADVDGQVYIKPGKGRRRFEEIPEEEKEYWSRVHDESTWYTGAAPKDEGAWRDGPWNLKTELDLKETLRQKADDPDRPLVQKVTQRKLGDKAGELEMRETTLKWMRNRDPDQLYLQILQNPPNGGQADALYSRIVEENPID